MMTRLFIPVLAFACSKAPSTGDTAQTDMPVHTLWSGWNHTWGLLSHRLSLIHIKAIDGTTASSGIMGGDWSTGEQWSDDVNYRVHQQRIAGEQLRVEHGETRLMVGPEGSATAVSRLSALDSATLVVLQGFEIDTDVAQNGDYPDDYDPALGYTSRGFGVTVALEDGQVKAQASVRWGPRDRPDVNSAVPFALTGVTVYWTAIDGAEGVTSSTYVANQDLAHAPPNSPQAGMSEPLAWSGTGVAAIQGFDLSLTDTDGGAGGDYLRSFGAEIRPSADGTPPENIGGEILTSAPIELGEMTMGLKIEALWITLDPDLNTITGDTIEGVHPVGRHTVPTE